MSAQQEQQYIICPTCEGSGSNKRGFVCPNCGGLGVGTFYQGRFYYWGSKISRTLIELNHVRERIHLILNIILFTFALIGLFSLGTWIYLASQYTSELGAFAFWRFKHPLILIFWLSVIADMFIFYRLSEEQKKNQKIKPPKYEDRTNRKNVPNNWSELKNQSSKYKINVAQGFSKQASDIVEKSYFLADKLNHDHIMPVHLFFSCLTDQEVAAIFTRLNVNNEKLLEKLKNQLTKIPQGKGKARLSNTVKEILIGAYLEALTLGQKKVSPKNFILYCVRKDKVLAEVLYDLDVEQDKIFNVVLWFIINEKLIESYRVYKKKARYKPSTNMDRAYTAVATPTLNHFGYDLTVAAKWGRLEYCVARHDDMERIFQNFESGSQGVILVGAPGVGKNTIINGIAQLMVREDVPKAFKDKRLVELDAARLISGATPAQVEGRMIVLMDEVVKSGNIILFIDNIENIIGITSGKEESLDLSEVLAGGLERNNIYFLATATDANYVKFIEGKSLGNIMTKIEVKEPEQNQAIQIIESKIGFLEGKYKIYFSYNALEEVIKLSKRYIHDKYLPDKAIKILELVAVKVQKKRGEQSLIGKEDIAEVISEMTNIPITKITQSEGQKLLNLEEQIHRRMVNQKEAVNMVAASLRRARVHLREGKRPIANFLFLGPTGVGKTELAKTVSELYFGDEKNMVRIDMSEYQHKDSIKKLIGDAMGAMGYLTEQIRKRPFSLVLLDEFEKAHPDILNLFLQVMDDGRLTDGQGRTIDFTNAILIATSNAGALYIQEQIFAGTEIETIKQTLINKHLNKVMRPELINRFDGVIVFEPLSMDNVVEITELMLENIRKLLESRGVSLEIDDDGLRKIAQEGFDPKFGARPLRRLLQDKIENIIANKILAGEIGRRDIVIIDQNADITVQKAREL